MLVLAVLICVLLRSGCSKTSFELSEVHAIEPKIQSQTEILNVVESILRTGHSPITPSSVIHSVHDPLAFPSLAANHKIGYGYQQRRPVVHNTKEVLRKLSVPTNLPVFKPPVNGIKGFRQIYFPLGEPNPMAESTFPPDSQLPGFDADHALPPSEDT